MFENHEILFNFATLTTNLITIVEKKRQNSAILLMHCPDQPGIIAVITEFINTNGGNILYLDQYVDRENSVFYMRVEWDLENFAIPANKIEEYFINSTM